MIELYTTLIINKRKTIDQVPEALRNDVHMALNRRGYNRNGDPVQVG